MKTQYHCTSILEIAQLFRQRAEACDKVADDGRLKASIEAARVEATTWRAAAEIVDCTVIVKPGEAAQ